MAGALCRERPYDDRGGKEERDATGIYPIKGNYLDNEMITKKCPDMMSGNVISYQNLLMSLSSFNCYQFSSALFSMYVIYNRLYAVSQRSVRGCGNGVQLYLNVVGPVSPISVQPLKCSGPLHRDVNVNAKWKKEKTSPLLKSKNLSQRPTQ